MPGLLPRIPNSTEQVQVDNMFTILPALSFISCCALLSSFLRRADFKCRNALGLDYTDLTHFCFSVALYMYILAL